MSLRLDVIAEEVRRRIARGLADGSLSPGARLPGTREAATEHDVDPRVVAAAYRKLEREGLVQCRPRSGTYVASKRTALVRQASAGAAWLAALLGQCKGHGLSLADAVDALRLCVSSIALRAVVVADGEDETAELCHELERNFAVLARGADESGALEGAGLVLATEARREQGAALAARLGATLVIAALNPELVGQLLSALAAGRVYIFVADPAFGRRLAEACARTVGERGLHVLVAGRDGPRIVGIGSRVFATRAARRLGVVAGSHPALDIRTVLAPSCERQILDWVVRRNLAAAAAPD